MKTTHWLRLHALRVQIALVHHERLRLKSKVGSLFTSAKTSLKVREQRRALLSKIEQLEQEIEKLRG